MTRVEQIRVDRMLGRLSYSNAWIALLNAGCTDPISVLGPIPISRSSLLGARGAMCDQQRLAVTRVDLRRTP